MKQPRTSTTLTTLTLFTTFTLCLAGCSPNQLATSKAPSEELSYSRQPTPPTTPNTPTTSTPSLSTSADVWQSFPPAPADEPDDITAIRKGWENFENEFDRLAKDSSITNLVPLTLTTTGSARESAVNAILKSRELGRVRRGKMIFRDAQINVPHTNAEGVTVSILSACKDFTNQQVIVESTGELADPGKGQDWVPTLLLTYTMQRQSSGSWVVADTSSRRDQC